MTRTVRTVEGGVERGVAAAAGWAASTFGGGNTGRIVSTDSEVAAMLAGDSSPWHTSAGTASELAGRHRDLSTRVMAFAGKMESAWTGNASDAAQVRMKKLSDTLTVTSDTFDANSQNVTSVATHFDATKSKLRPLPNPAPEKGFVDKITPWDTDTEDAINEYNATAAHNAQAYKSYATSTRAQGMVLMADYGRLGEFDGGDVTLAPSPAAGGSATGRSTAGRGTTEGRNSSGRGDTAMPPPAATAGGHEESGDRVSDDRGVPAQVPPRQGGGSDRTSTAGWTPPALEPGAGPRGGLPPGVPGDQQRSAPYPGGFGWNPASGSLPDGGLPGSRSGAGGKVPGESGRSGAPGSGSRSGSLGEEPVARGGRGGTRAGGRGANPPGAMAPGAGRGKGEEDREHQRKYVLDEDQLFDGDDGLRDPETGYRAAPPTIGA
ncbi:hypothetical protein [Amycolatopsis sp. cmx-4-68]|uniref:hypothetical protein n=1 Tax=Amycolatopsis sp. cmx-4-68 TaxID=2790938 RepID=UPI00397AA343